MGRRGRKRERGRNLLQQHYLLDGIARRNADLRVISAQRFREFVLSEK